MEKPKNSILWFNEIGIEAVPGVTPVMNAELGPFETPLPVSICHTLKVKRPLYSGPGCSRFTIVAT